MDYLKTIETLKLKSLETLYFGYLRGWLDRKAILDLAMAELDESTVETKLAQIALDNESDEDEFKTLVSAYLDEIGKNLDSKHESLLKEKWLLIFLETLKNNALDEEQKLNKLQEIYAEFNYPEEMQSCSIYSNDNIGPLKAMDDLIQKIKTKYSLA